MNFVKRSDVVDKVAHKFTPVLISELGGYVNVRPLTGSEQLEIEREQFENERDKKFFDVSLKMLSKVVCDEDGEPLFPGDQGMKDLGAKPKSVLMKLNVALKEINEIPDIEGFIESLKKVDGGEPISISVEQ